MQIIISDYYAVSYRQHENELLISRFQWICFIVPPASLHIASRDSNLFHL